MKPIFPIPSKETLYNFIVHSNAIEHLVIDLDEIIATHQRRAIHPLAAGHFIAINYLHKNLACNSDFPCRHELQFESVPKSNANLFWLRDLHQKLMAPVANHDNRPILTEAILKANPNDPKATSINHTAAAQMGESLSPLDCGRYRLHPRVIGLNRKMPKPNSIETLLHHWYKKLGQFHLGIASKLRRPDNDTLQACVNMAEELAIQLQCIHPFVDGTGRTSRLVENLLRQRWALPWKTILKEDAISYVKKIMEYEDSEDWQLLLANCKAK